MSHYPNPFDFVPFPSAPILRTEAEFDNMGDKFSGYLELEIRALTPVHVVGRVEDRTERKSLFFRQSGLPCIPSSSIRGCLRAFTEALTAGWISRANTNYPKEYGGRHVGFNIFESDPEMGNRRTSAFKPKANSNEIDVATYLFGTVIEGKPTEYEVQSSKSRVWVEDAYIPLEAIAFREDWWAPDIRGKAFMGGAKPSASNWWYFEPEKVWRRNLSNKDGSPMKDGFGRRQEVAEFIGYNLRGRKFYYHQDPVACVKIYHRDYNYWNYNNNFDPVCLECMQQDALTNTFRLYLDSIPRSLFLLLLRILLLQPKATMRHKVGYAKSYGYGSIEFILKSAQLRTASPGIPKALKVWNIIAGSWSEAALAHAGLTDLIDHNALAWLARILGWPHNDLLFVYPRYRAHEFQQAIKYKQFLNELKNRGLTIADKMIVNPKDGRAIAEAVWNVKKPIDFRLYQERAVGWDIIMQRIP